MVFLSPDCIPNRFYYQNSTKTSNTEKAEHEICLEVKNNEIIKEIIKDEKSVP